MMPERTNDPIPADVLEWINWGKTAFNAERVEARWTAQHVWLIIDGESRGYWNR